ncbi:LacI family DNA-binding transcriptional regulator [Clostridium folliculivorans]|uniref:LacI family transcriptional regulator n=1 Tax=Clostridium folliculivorans TaxID=2886038 RepID=A0A9W5Y5U1_9CLOT|nr:LacI family DNA-binding transcriptional regulator [Clostridium folliculivorans]GKU27038.1 LacI family transcriptional regulator [Clostridium folliculivorans]GKU29120.1 LacI family transcriptional regulator [Clostridium folliculivorans]
MQGKNITIRDVAKKAGVSISTVSRAFNKYEDISESTREHILKVAADLGYHPNIVAKSLSANRNYRMAIIVEDYMPDDYATYEIFMAFRSELSEQGYETIILSTTTDIQKVENLSKIPQEKQVDGVFILGLKMTDEYFKQLESFKYPCVLYDISIKNDLCCSVGVDNLKGAAKAVEHLIEQGHEKIAFINGHEDAQVSYERLDGYYLALARQGLLIDKKLVINGGFSFDGGKEAAVKLISEHEEITAIFCASDLMACGAMEGIKEMGFSIPDDISVVGFDDINICEYVTPKLTTIRQERDKIGRTAALQLVEMINGKSPARSIIEPTLIVRESSVKIKK